MLLWISSLCITEPIAYLTRSIWAKNVRIRHNTSCSYIYEYEFSPMGDLAICSFPGLTLEWLDFIRDNRSKGGVQHQLTW